MKNWLIHIVLVLLASIAAAAQPTSWNFTRTSRTSNFYFEANFLQINGVTIAPSDSDAIGIFVKTPTDSDLCVGFARVRPNDTTQVIAYAKDSLGDGFVNGQTYSIRYWRYVAKCELEVNTTHPAKAISQNEIYYIDAATGLLANVIYTKDAYKVSDPDPTPINTQGKEVSFLPNSSNIVVNSKTGTISLGKSKPGNFLIYVSSNFCLVKDTLQVAIIPDSVTKLALNIRQLKYNMLHPTCTRTGEIHIVTNSIIGNRPLKFYLKNTQDNTIKANTSGFFDNLHEGYYAIMVEDSSGFVATYPHPILLTKSTEDCPNLVLMPDGRQGVAAVFIPEAGMAKIFNREGVLVKEISIPGEWNGTDQRGAPVPMGDYYLFVNETQSKVITILR